MKACWRNHKEAEVGGRRMPLRLTYEAMAVVPSYKLLNENLSTRDYTDSFVLDHWLTLWVGCCWTVPNPPID